MEDNKTLDKDSAIVYDKNIYGNVAKATPIPQPNIGLETDHSVINDLIETSDQSLINTSVINSFLDVSKQRDRQYAIIDEMCDDSIPSAILEQYTEDTTATNEDNKVVWITSDDPIIQKACTYIINSFQVNKNIYKWANSLIKYGDVYLKLFRQSEYDNDPIFKDKKQLNEDINIHLNKENDHFVNYAEMVDNPATMYELLRLGKTAGFIKTHIQATNTTNNQNNLFDQANNTFKYTFNQNDIDIYQQNQYVHASLDDNVDRISEEVEIIRDLSHNITDDDKTNSFTYKVRSGRSVFYSSFKIWRLLSLLENSLTLSRLTKSSITRVIQVEVGNIDKLEVKPILQSVKQMIEQKAAINPGTSFNEYNNPGPVENNIYVPTKEGKGAITTSQIGGDYDPKALTDIDYFKNKFYGSFGIPKAWFGDTDDSTGFNGGTSLTIISSKYAKKIIKIQTALCEMIKTLVNIILIDRGLSKYINKFTVNMLKPITQEDIDRTEAESNRFRVVSDTLSLFSDIDDKATKLKLLKTLISQINDSPEILEILEEEIAKLESGENTESNKNTTENEDNFSNEDNFDLDQALGFNNEDKENIEVQNIEETPEEEIENEEEILPTPGETGVDLINNTEEEI